MRFIYLLVLLPAFGLAQKPALSLESGKYIYYQSFSFKQNHSKDTLYARALRFFSSSEKQFRTVMRMGDSAIFVRGQFLINKTAVSLSHPAGQITYELTSEFRDNKFRYWVTSFVFSPYRRDRYGNFEKAPNQQVPLEKPPGKLNKGEWNANTEATALESKAIGEKLYQFLDKDPEIKRSGIPGKW